MLRTLRWTRWTAVALASITLSCGGGDGGTEPTPTPPVIRVNVEPATFQIDIGATQALTATVTSDGTPTASAVTWTSSDNSIATVSGAGVVTGVAEGSVTITASSQGATDTSAGTVVDPNPPATPPSVAVRAISDTEVELTWEDAGNEDEYRVERQQSGGGGLSAMAFEEIAVLPANTVSYVDSDLDPEATYEYRVRACNQNGCSEFGDPDEPVTTLPTLVIETNSLPPGTTNVEYSATLEASGGDEVYEWSITSGALPAGLTLDTDGSISGTPTEFGEFPITFQVESGGQTKTVEITLEITEQILPPEVATTELPPGAVGAAYEETLEATLGDGSYVWEITGGALPDGLDMSAAGVVSGTPTTAGEASFDVQVTSAEMTGDGTVTITIFEAVAITTDALADATEGAEYSATFEATGGDGVYTWSVVSGELPAGLTLAEDGTLSGTPTESGDFEVTYSVESGDGQTAEVVLTLTVIPAVAITTETLDDGTFEAAYEATLAATGGDETFTWAIAEGTLPPGLDLAEGTGVISGTPSEVGTFDFTVEVTSGDGQVVTAELSITIAPAAVVITTESLTQGTVNVAYEATLEASGGDGVNYSWAVTSGSLPAGLDLDANTGVISGTPTTEETANFTVEVTSGGMTDTADLSIEIGAEILAPLVDTTELPDGLEGAAYEETLAASRGDGAYTWAITAGALPDGLDLDENTGVISGTPTTPGDFDFTVEVTSAGMTGTADLSITIVGLLEITTTTLPNGTAGEAYSQTLTSTGGTAPITWAVTVGALPDGLDLDENTGEISGTPTTAETADFTVEATSTDGQTDDQALSITVAAGAPVSLEKSLLRGGNIGVGYNDQIDAATGGTGTYTYTVTDGALPGGLSLNASTGAITGTPNASGAFYFELTASSGGSDDSAIFMITISTTAASAFNMWAVNVADVIPSAAFQTQLNAVLARWEEIVTGEAPDFGGASPLASNQCNGFGELVEDEPVDDFMILINAGPIDGAGSTLGFGGPCGFIRGAGPHLVYGQFTIDTADLPGFSANELFTVMWHEIGHAMGIGTIWDQIGFALIDGKGGATPTYNGAAAVAEYATLGGTGDIPVEQDGGEGTADSHWDEETFDDEMMTGISDGTLAPISRMSIASLADLGWTVNLNAADSYSIPGCSPACLRAGDEHREPFDYVLYEDLVLPLGNGRFRIFRATGPVRR